MRLEEVENYIFEKYGDYFSPQPDTGCWLWERTTVGPNLGYARVWDRGRNRLVNSIVKEMMGWKAQDVRHTCGISCCVNPRHLTFGTRSQNILDRSIEDRQETHRKAKIGWTPEMLSERNRKVRAAQLAKMTPEQRAEVASKASKARWAGKSDLERKAETKAMREAQSSEQLSANAQKANAIRWWWEKRK